MSTIKVSLPAVPVEEEITWDQIRVYLSATGWEKRITGDDGVDLWVRPCEKRYRIDQIWVGALTGEDPKPLVERLIRSLAAHAGWTPGDVLRKIARREGHPGSDGACSWINGEGVRSLQDGLYNHVQWLEWHARVGVWEKAAKIAQSMAGIHDAPAGSFVAGAIVHALREAAKQDQEPGKEKP